MFSPLSEGTPGEGYGIGQTQSNGFSIPFHRKTLSSGAYEKVLALLCRRCLQIQKDKENRTNHTAGNQLMQSRHGLLVAVLAKFPIWFGSLAITAPDHVSLPEFQDWPATMPTRCLCEESRTTRHSTCGQPLDGPPEPQQPQHRPRQNRTSIRCSTAGPWTSSRSRGDDMQGTVPRGAKSPTRLEPQRKCSGQPYPARFRPSAKRHKQSRAGRPVQTPDLHTSDRSVQTGGA